MRVSRGHSGGKCLFLMAFERSDQGHDVRQQLDLVINAARN